MYTIKFFSRAISPIFYISQLFWWRRPPPPPHPTWQHHSAVLHRWHLSIVVCYTRRADNNGVMTRVIQQQRVVVQPQPAETPARSVPRSRGQRYRWGAWIWARLYANWSTGLDFEANISLPCLEFQFSVPRCTFGFQPHQIWPKTLLHEMFFFGVQPYAKKG